jgi:hypothetical protein
MSVRFPSKQGARLGLDDRVGPQTCFHQTRTYFARDGETKRTKAKNLAVSVLSLLTRPILPASLVPPSFTLPAVL